MNVITDWLQQHAGKVILLVIVMAIAMIEIGRASCRERV